MKKDNWHQFFSQYPGNSYLCRYCGGRYWKEKTAKHHYQVIMAHLEILENQMKGGEE